MPPMLSPEELNNPCICSCNDFFIKSTTSGFISSISAIRLTTSSLASVGNRAKISLACRALKLARIKAIVCGCSVFKISVTLGGAAFSMKSKGLPSIWRCACSMIDSTFSSLSTLPSKERAYCNPPCEMYSEANINIRHSRNTSNLASACTICVFPIRMVRSLIVVSSSFSITAADFSSPSVIIRIAAFSGPLNSGGI